MLKADGVHSTPPMNTSAPTPQSSRRGFLVQATAVAAAGAAIGASLPLPAPTAASAQSSAAEADPIFVAIEAHRRAIAALEEAANTEMALEVSLPRDQRQSDIRAWIEKIVETDDPRWPAALRARKEASNAMDDGAIDLVNTEPTTVAGVEGLLRYFADQEKELFPEDVSDDDGSVEAFGACLVRHAADALRKIAHSSPV
jgi:hypothetical protein